MRRERLPALLLAAGVAFGVLRVPHAVWGKRLGEIAAFRAQGAAAFHLRYLDPSGASARWLEWLRVTTPEESVVLFQGEEKGAFEFAAALLFPRILVKAHAVGDQAAAYAGRPIARGRLPEGGRSGALMLVAAARRLRVEVRE